MPSTGLSDSLGLSLAHWRNFRAFVGCTWAGHRLACKPISLSVPCNISPRQEKMTLYSSTRHISLSPLLSSRLSFLFSSLSFWPFFSFPVLSFYLFSSFPSALPFLYPAIPIFILPHHPLPFVLFSFPSPYFLYFSLSRHPHLHSPPSPSSPPSFIHSIRLLCIGLKEDEGSSCGKVAPRRMRRLDGCRAGSSVP